MITPSARQYLKDRKIELVFEEERGEKEEQKPAGYIFAEAGCPMDEKPEYMTQLYGKRLVYKNHPRIILRGAIDSLQSRILLLQAEAAEEKKDKLVDELEEVLQYVRNIMRCEVLEEEFAAIKLLGLEDEELRRQSHNPPKFFGMKHILPDHGMGRLALLLNALRSNVREVEACAVAAFRKEEGMEREDLVKALNRLSSCIYIMMLKYLNGAYR